MTDIATAILAIKSDAQMTIDNEDVNKIIWHDGNPTSITNDQIIAKQAELQTAYDNKKYQRDRAEEYPSWQDQMDMQYHDKVNGTSTWQTAIAKVKSDNPKE